MNKVANDDYFYEDETVKSWKTQVIEDRREDYLSKKEARDIWDAIDEIDTTNDYSAQEGILSNRAVCDAYEEPWHAFETVKGFSPQAKYFAKEIMPMFADIIQKELLTGGEDDDA